VIFHLVHHHSIGPAQSPFRIVERETGHEVVWINRFLDRECVRRLAETTLRSYALDLLHFLNDWLVRHIQGEDLAYAEYSARRKERSMLGRFFKLFT